MRSYEDDIYQARCLCCSKNLSIKSMGISALKSHESQSMHQKKFLLWNTTPKINFIKTSSIPAPIKNVACTMDTSLVKEETLKAEIIWAFKVVGDHSSFNSCSDISDVFSMMFPDSDIVKKFTCGSNKKLTYFVDNVYIRSTVEVKLFIYKRKSTKAFRRVESIISVILSSNFAKQIS